MADILAPPVQDSISLSQPSDRPDAHTQKYDRQLRLWGAGGQIGLESARVLLVGGNSTATQALKNLVLPGIGHFTLTSPITSTTPSDLGPNFFLSPPSLSQPLAPSAVSHLLELNSDVSGMGLTLSPSQITGELVGEHSLVVAVDVEDPREYVRLAEECWGRKVPFVGVKSVGFFGMVRVQVEELCIVESHPSSLVDLRVHHPFPALLQYADTFSFDTMDSAEHGHVPAVVILVKGLREWEREHSSLPLTFKDRQAFTKSILALKRQSDEENFDEAVALFRRAGGGEKVPKDVERLFGDEKCENVDKDSTNFWLLLRSIRAFTRLPSSCGLLPLSGALPDMKSHSSTYITLQNIYKKKAKEDCAEVRRLLDELCGRVGIEGGSQERVGEEELESFVKHAAWVKVIRGRRVKEEMAEGGSRIKGRTGELVMSAYAQPLTDTSLFVYLALRAADAFYLLHSRYPGSYPSFSFPSSATPEALEADALELEGIARKLLIEWKGEEKWEETVGWDEEEQGEKVWRKVGEVCREITRTPPSTTLPQTSALLGGLVAQEAIKLVTRQYVPLGTVLTAGGKGYVGGETSVWDGVRSGSGVLDA
ncbi:hypothetical protein JCM8547_000601 [Rhodosporidiobolus lusitaniae]